MSFAIPIRIAARSLALAALVTGAVSVSLAAAQAAPELASASVSGVTVTLTGSGLGAVSSVRVGSQMLTNVTARADGTVVTGLLPTPVDPGNYLVVLVTAGSTLGCLTARPGADWACVNGGWVPPSHPLASSALITLTTQLTVAPSGPVAFAAYHADGQFLAPMIDAIDGYFALLIDEDWYSLRLTRRGYARTSSDALVYLDSVCSDGPYGSSSSWDPDLELFLPLRVYRTDATVGYAPQRQGQLTYTGYQWWRADPDDTTCHNGGPVTNSKFFRVKAVMLPTLKTPLQIRASPVK